jgi:small subunit ribosomal protein S19
MSRSKIKGPYINIKSNENKKYALKIASRDSEILPEFVGQTFKVHNGKTFLELNVVDDMIGHKFGEFSFTRVKFFFKKKKSTKKSKK